MPRKPDKRIEQAQALYLKGLKLVDISKQLDRPEGTVRRWKSTYKWDNERSDKNKGARSGNKNASGHGAPKKNSNAEKHGLFRKYLPEETFSIIQETPDDPLDVLWDQIQIRNGIAKYIQLHTNRFDKIYLASNGQEAKRADILPYTMTLSGYDEFKYCQQALRLGEREYLLKPVRSSDILQMVNRAADELFGAQENAKTEPSEEKNHVVELAKEYVEEHYYENLTLADVAQRVGISAGYLSTLFQKQLSKGFVDYLKNCLLNIYPSVTYQTFEGFGGALTESAGYIYGQMNEEQKRQMLEEYFSIDRMEYGMVRIPVDSCDFSLGHYEAADWRSCLRRGVLLHT